MWKSSSCFAAAASLSIGNFSMKSCTIFFGITKWHHRRAEAADDGEDVAERDHYL